MKQLVRIIRGTDWKVELSKLIKLFTLASVDYETDRKIQDTIATEFADRTILCIARAYFKMTSPFLRNFSYYIPSFQTDYEPLLDTTGYVSWTQAESQSLIHPRISTNRPTVYSAECATGLQSPWTTSSSLQKLLKTKHIRFGHLYWDHERSIFHIY